MYTVARHPDAKSPSSFFKWAIFFNGELFEGFRTREDAETELRELQTL